MNNFVFAPDETLAAARSSGRTDIIYYLVFRFMVKEFLSVFILFFSNEMWVIVRPLGRGALFLKK